MRSCVLSKSVCEFVCVCEREMLPSVYSRDTHFCNLSVCCSIPTLRRIRKSSWHKTLAWQYFKSTTGELVHLSPLFSAAPPDDPSAVARFPSFYFYICAVCTRTNFPRREFQHLYIFSSHDGRISLVYMKWMRGAEPPLGIKRNARHVIAVWEHYGYAVVPETICSCAKMDIFLSRARTECVCINSRRERE